MKPPKIVIVCGAAYVSGKEIVSLHLARALRDAGCSVEFVTSQWHDGEFVRRLEAAGLPHCSLRIGFMSMTLKWRPLRATLVQFMYLPALVLQYCRLIRRSAPDAIVHTNWHHALLLMPFLKPSRDVFWLHEMAPRRRRFARLYQAIARRTARIICVSRAVAECLLTLGIAPAHIRVIHNGVPAAARREPPGAQKLLRLGIVGQIGAWKGHDDLVDAMAILLRDGEPVHLRIFGAGNDAYVDSLKRNIERLQIGAHVEWRGFVRQQDDIYNGIDVCVMPSRFEEPFSTAALEAGAHARPVICTARGGFGEIVQDGVTGIVVPAQRPDALAEAIAGQARDRNLLRRMGEAARHRVAAEFSMAAFAARFIEALPLPSARAP